MTMSVTLMRDAAQLLGFGLRPTLRPALEPEYEVLLRRFRQDGELRAAVRAVAEGLGLSILGETDHGLVLGADTGGPFTPTLARYKRNMRPDERMTHGLVLLAISAFSFPTGADLDESDEVLGPRMGVDVLVRYLVDRCREMESRSGRDPDLGSPELEEAYHKVLRLAETRGSKDGRRSASSLEGMVLHALEHLRMGGLVHRVSDVDGGTYQALGSFRLQVREMAGLELFRLVREASPVAEPEGQSS